jgi:hypothetical protein
MGMPKERDHYEDQDMWVGNIKMDLGELEWDGMDWDDRDQDRDWWKTFVGIVINLRVL